MVSLYDGGIYLVNGKEIVNTAKAQADNVKASLSANAKIYVNSPGVHIEKDCDKSYAKPGDVIGYMGHTGYSTTENVNNIEVTHLHWGLELVFDEEQKESDNEIWIDVYPLTCFLAKHTQEVQKVEGTREWIRTTKIREF